MAAAPPVEVPTAGVARAVSTEPAVWDPAASLAEAERAEERA